MSLSKHQEEKVKELFALIDAGNSFVCLRGSAGTGKTYVLNYLIEKYSEQLALHQILCSAPTHKALSVIRNKVLLDVKFNTLHSELQYRMVYGKEGEKLFVSKPNLKSPPLSTTKFWIIDEASMIGAEMLDNIEYWAKSKEVTVIFVGDHKQINPVNELNSPVFYKDYPQVELTEIVRQGKGNPIISLSNDVGSLFNKEPQFQIEDNSQDIKGYLYTTNEDKIIEELALVNGTDDIKYLAYTNEEVDRINSLVRQRLYGYKPNKIELGETIIFDSPYVTPSEVLYTTNQELKIEEVHRHPMTFNVIVDDSKPKKPITENFTLWVYRVNGDIKILDDKSLFEYRKITNILKKNCRDGILSFKGRDTFLDQFAYFKYNHAITVHKSQGSTYRRTILNVNNLNSNFNATEKQRLFYTGITRASDLLILYYK